MSPSTGDFRLKFGSPAIDSANAGVSGQPSSDVGGVARIDDPATPNTGVGPVRTTTAAHTSTTSRTAPRGRHRRLAAFRRRRPGVTADASASFDNDGVAPIATYRFDFGDGTDAVGPQSGATASHRYTSAGTYTVTVTVKDTQGLSSTATDTVTVTDNPPNASLAVTPDSGRSPLAVSADASGSTDTDGTPISSYTFDFGDGTDPVGPQSGATATHTFMAAGTYTVTVTVKDTAGQTSRATAQVTVFGDNAPPSAALSVTPTTGTVDLAVTADASASTDPDDGIASYRFDFGDGTPVVGPQSGATATHTYHAGGSFTVTTTVTDNAVCRRRQPRG